LIYVYQRLSGYFAVSDRQEVKAHIYSCL